MRLLLPFLLALPAVTAAQPLQERIDGGQRICVYGARPGYTSEVQDLEARVSVSQPCPSRPPPRPGVGRPPNTAMLVAEEIAEGLRSCRYQQGEEIWTIPIPITRACPITAGETLALIPDEDRN